MTKVNVDFYCTVLLCFPFHMCENNTKIPVLSLNVNCKFSPPFCERKKSRAMFLIASASKNFLGGKAKIFHLAAVKQLSREHKQTNVAHQAPPHNVSAKSSLSWDSTEEPQVNPGREPTGLQKITMHWQEVGITPLQPNTHLLLSSQPPVHVSQDVQPSQLPHRPFHTYKLTSSCTLYKTTH